MISIWPNAMNCPQQEDFKRKGLLLNGTSVYDAFNPSARELYWSYANKEFFSNGFDAWWCDASEPLDADWTFMKDGYGIDNHRQRWELNTNLLSSVLGAERSQLYSLYHAMGIYENQRLVNENKRVVNLTRSSYAGQQRYSTITWNGDTRATWQSFAQMIPAGLILWLLAVPIGLWILELFLRRMAHNGFGKAITIKEWLIWRIGNYIPECFNMVHSCLYSEVMVPILPVKCGVLVNRA